MPRTYMARADTVERRWCVVDLEGLTLGRVASRIASVLRGKNKPQYTPHVDVGDYVVAVNASKIKLTGKKWTDKLYRHHTGYPGGLKTLTAEQLRAKKPEQLIKLAVKGMLPNTPLGRRMFKKLKVYPTAEHPHAAQAPELLVPGRTGPPDAA